MTNTTAQDISYPSKLQNAKRNTRSLASAQPAVMEAFAGLHKAAVATGALDTRIKELMALAISITARCDDCIAHHTHDALEAGATREEVAEAITEVVAPIAETVKTVAEVVQGLLKSDETKISEKAEDTPAASIAALVARNFRAVGSDKTKVDGEEEIEGPKEADHEKNITGIPFLDKMLSEE